LSRVWAITLNTFREAIRNRILYAFLFFSLLFIAAATLLSHLTIGEYGKVVKDLGLASITIFGVLIAIFVGIGLVNREIERKTIYTIASKPISRPAIILGKYLGLVLVLVLLLCLMGVAYVITLSVNTVPIDAGIFLALFMALLELMLITAFSVMYSTFAGPTVATFLSLSTFVIGHLTVDIQTMGAEAEDSTMQTLSAVAYWVLPNLEAFNVRTEVVYNAPIPLEFVAFSAGYGLLYSAIVVGIAAIIFHYRDF